nr:type I-E CRISPR-associated protein Cse2/CasB [uncultured Halomonas sp.]
MSDVLENPSESLGTDNAQEAKRCRVLTPQERYAVRRWWQRLTLNEAEARERKLQPPWPRGVRAILRRCEAPEAAVLTEGFRKLWHMLEKEAPSSELPKYKQRDMQAWACVATVLAELRNEQSGASLGRQLAQQKESTGKPQLSELRFQQLQQSHSADELVRRLRRALALIGHKGVSSVSLADDILLWCQEHDGDGFRPNRTEDRLAFRWANDYFTTLAKYQREDH